MLPDLAAAFRAHVERGLSFEGIPEKLCDPLTVCDLLSNNIESMPTSLCVLLRLPQGSQYARGVRELRALIAQEVRRREAEP